VDVLRRSALILALVAAASSAGGCYDFTMADWVDAGDDGGTDTDSDTDSDTDACDPGFAGEDCEVCVRYVDADSTAPEPDGLRWHRAFTELQPAIDSAVEAVEGALTECSVWVAEGMYFTYETDPADSVRLAPHVPVYGGFSGDETALYQRDWLNHETVLDGRDSADGEFHVYHVVRGADETTLDGFTVTEGDAFQGTSPMNPNNWGGGMLNLDVSPTVANCTFVDNQGFFGGAIENMVTEEEGVCSPLITDCLFQNNHAGAFGGAVDNDNSAPTIAGCTFVGNSSVMGGGAINNLYATLTLSGSDFQDNSTSEAEAHSGGAIFNSAETQDINDCTFSGNAAADGGAIYSDYGATTTILGSQFSANTATFHGGAIASVTANPSITNCRFDQNVAAEYAGGVAAMANSVIEVTDSVFTANVGNDGGGLMVYESEGTVDGCAFTLNEAAWGGGISSYTATSLTVESSSFSSNEVTQGGGGLDAWYDSPVIRSSVFAANRAAVGGGVLAQGSIGAELENCVFAGNYSINPTTSGGGGLLVNENGVAQVRSCTFTDNDAGNAGGGILGEASSQIDVDNTIFHGDTPDAISTLTLATATVAYSDVEGGYAGGGNLDADPLFVDNLDSTSAWAEVSYDAGLHRSVLTDSSAEFEPDGLVGAIVKPSLGSVREFAIAGNTATEIYVHGDVTEIATAGGTYSLRDLHLILASPCIDAADGDVAPETDIDGTGRVNIASVPDTGVGSPDHVDLGAQEYYPANLIGPDEFGYVAYHDENVDVCDDISATGTEIVDMANDASVEVSLGSVFEFYGTEYNSVYVNSNGALSFGGEIFNSFANAELPTGTYQMIAAYWDDMNPETGGGVYHQFDGGLFQVMWNAPHSSDSETELYDVRAVIDTVSGEIHVCYVTTDVGSYPLGVDATAGIQGSSPVSALAYSYNSSELTEGLHVRYVPPED